MSPFHRHVRFAGLSIAALLASTDANAQSADAPPPPASPAATSASPATAPASRGISSQPQLGDIVVTARRRAENIQNVPIAITALTGAMLEQHNIRTAEDVQYITPSLSVRGGSFNRIGIDYAIRGTPPGGTLIYRNEVPELVDSFLFTSAAVPYFDIDSVQVLKGPQGTLFGGTSTGGAVLISTAKPRDDFEGYISGTYGNLNARYLEGAVNVPIVSDKVLLRVAGLLRRRDGYTYNIFNGQHLDNQDTDSIRASLTVLPFSGVENTTVYEYNYRHERVGNTLPLLCNPNGSINGGMGTGPGTWYAQCTANAALGPRTLNEDGEGLAVLKQSFISNVTTIEIGEKLTLKNIFGYTNYKGENTQDSDGTSFVGTSYGVSGAVNPFPKYKFSQQQQISEELQLQGKSLDDHLTWIVGGFYMKHYEPNYNHLFADVGLPFLINVVYRVHSDEKAVFAQGTYDFGGLLRGVSLTGGLRDSWDRNNTFSAQNACRSGTAQLQCVGFENAASLFDPTFTDFNYLADGVVTKANSNKLTYNVTLNYKPISDVLLYVTKRRGYRPGGVQTTALAAFASYKPEVNDDWEVGVKSKFRIGDVPARVNVAAWSDNYKDLQRSASIEPSVGLTVNAQKARLRGVEIDATIEPARWFTLDANYAHLDNQFKKFLIDFPPLAAGQSIIPVDESGSPFPLAPSDAYSISGTVTVPTSERFGKLTVTATWSHRSKVHLANDPFFQPELQQKGYGLLDLQAQIASIAGTGADILLFAKNVTDKTYIDGSGNNTYNFNPYESTGVDTVFYGEPRTYGVTVRYRFGG